LAHNQPVVITGDNYEQIRGLFSDTDIQIYVFNIAKFNSDSKESKKGTPRIKRLSEYLDNPISISFQVSTIWLYSWTKHTATMQMLLKRLLMNYVLYLVWR